MNQTLRCELQQNNFVLKKGLNATISQVSILANDLGEQLSQLDINGFINSLLVGIKKRDRSFICQKIHETWT